MSDGRVAGKVALVTGAGRGQGRAQAVRLAEEGADVVVVDLAAEIDDAPYAVFAAENLDETAALVEATGRRAVRCRADVRDRDALRAAAEAGLDALGRLDVVVANAGIGGGGALLDLDPAQWQAMIDINLTGLFNTVQAAVPVMIRAGHGGSVVVINSIAGLKGIAGCGHYAAAKHGGVGLARTLAIELAPHDIRVNLVCPTGVSSPMMLNDWSRRLFRPDLEHPTDDDVAEVLGDHHLLDTPWVTPIDVSHAVLFLASDEARYITGAALPVDAGALTK